jgi:hypothetical protein
MNKKDKIPAGKQTRTLRIRRFTKQESALTWKSGTNWNFNTPTQTSIRKVKIMIHGIQIEMVEANIGKSS